MTKTNINSDVPAHALSAAMTAVFKGHFRKRMREIADFEIEKLLAEGLSNLKITDATEGLEVSIMMKHEFQLKDSE